MGMIHMGERERGMDRLLDLDALNPAEREALALLAEGHTAKSIAELTGRSVAPSTRGCARHGARPASAVVANWRACSRLLRKIVTRKSIWLHPSDRRQRPIRKPARPAGDGKDRSSCLSS